SGARRARSARAGSFMSSPLLRARCRTRARPRSSCCSSSAGRTVTSSGTATSSIPSGISRGGRHSARSDGPDGAEHRGSRALPVFPPRVDAASPAADRRARAGGWFYVASVMRGPHAFWFYKGKPPAPERWQLDPTHVREYASEEEFRAALAHPELELDMVRSAQLKFALTDFAARVAARARLIRTEQLPELYVEGPLWLTRARRAIGIPIPGYRWVEATGRKRVS